MHAQLFVPGPVIMHVAFGSQPPLAVRHALIAAQTVPLPAKPPLQAHEFVPGPVLVQRALGSQPPLFERQLLIAA